MARLNIEPTRDDIDELIAQATQARENAATSLEIVAHTGGVTYLEKLKKKLDLDQESKPTGKKLLKSKAKEKLLKELQAWREAVGTEEPTDYKKGELRVMQWANEAYDFRITDEEWA